MFYSNRIFRTVKNQIFAELLLKRESHLKGSYFYWSQTETERGGERAHHDITKKAESWKKKKKKKVLTGF